MVIDINEAEQILLLQAAKKTMDDINLSEQLRTNLNLSHNDFKFYKERFYTLVTLGPRAGIYPYDTEKYLVITEAARITLADLKLSDELIKDLKLDNGELNDFRDKLFTKLKIDIPQQLIDAARQERIAYHTKVMVDPADYLQNNEYGKIVSQAVQGKDKISIDTLPDQLADLAKHLVILKGYLFAEDHRLAEGSVEQYVASEKERLDSFCSWWHEQHQSKPTDYPLIMDKSDWNEQYDLFDEGNDQSPRP